MIRLAIVWKVLTKKEKRKLFFGFQLFVRLLPLPQGGDNAIQVLNHSTEAAKRVRPNQNL